MQAYTERGLRAERGHGARGKTERGSHGARKAVSGKRGSGQRYKQSRRRISWCEERKYMHLVPVSILFCTELNGNEIREYK